MMKLFFFSSFTTTGSALYSSSGTSRGKKGTRNKTKKSRRG
jgi:hypothetical protein